MVDLWPRPGLLLSPYLSFCHFSQTNSWQRPMFSCWQTLLELIPVWAIPTVKLPKNTLHSVGILPWRGSVHVSPDVSRPLLTGRVTTRAKWPPGLTGRKSGSRFVNLADSYNFEQAHEKHGSIKNTSPVDFGTPCRSVYTVYGYLPNWYLLCCRNAPVFS